MICDSHTHIDLNDLNFFRKENMAISACAMEPPSAALLLDATKDINNIFVSCAIHPMNSDKYSIDEITPYLEKVNLIGEIGMDSTWCDVDIKIQEDIFIKQLDIAQSLNKAIIVHTKGEERRIAEILKNYSMNKIIHWYSSPLYLNSYIDLDSYFTVGPSILVEEKSVLDLVKKVDISRLMIESDGIDAINWALRKNYSLEETPKVLERMIEKIASIKGLSKRCVEKAVEKNFFIFNK